MPLLTDRTIKNAQPKEKSYRLYDGNSLYVEIMPTGAKYFRGKYYFSGKERRKALGVYPKVSLKEARDKWLEDRKALAKGIDPAHRSTSDEFELVAMEWFKKFSENWAVAHADRVLKRFKRDIFPLLGNRPLQEVTPKELLLVIRKIEERGALETAHRALQTISQVFRYAIVTARTERNPANDLQGSLPTPKRKNFAALTTPKEVGELLRAIDGHYCHKSVKAALLLAPLVFVRPNELRKAEWPEIDLKKAEWTIPAEKMKQDRPHLVPLSIQAVKILSDLKPFSKGNYVFSHPRHYDRPMSNNGVLSALRAMGYTSEQMTGHGFRAMARTMMDEQLGIRPDIIEHQLAHAVKDPLGRAYNRTSYLPERKKMMQDWADYLDKLRLKQIL